MEMHTNTIRQAEYRNRKAAAGNVRVSVWLTPRAYAALTAIASRQETSREKVVVGLLERAA
jgi:hypothetical protein